MVQKAQAAVMNRPNFAIDAIGDSDDEGGDEGEGGDDAVMDEVEAFLKAHGDDDEGLKGEQKKVAAGELASSAVTQADHQTCSRLIRWARVTEDPVISSIYSIPVEDCNRTVAV